MDDQTDNRRVAILYKRGAQPDEALVELLETELTAAGFQVFIDRHLEVGMDWARELETQIREADAVVPLISEASLSSEMMAFEVEHANDVARATNGRPALMPVRVDYTGPLTEPMAGILDPIQYILWDGEYTNEGLVAELTYALKSLAPAASSAALPEKGERLTPKLAARIEKAKVKPELEELVSTLPRALESVGGAVPLSSEFYLPRPADEQLAEALEQRDSIVLIKGARQMGKTSLLARGLAAARERGDVVSSLDLQKLSGTNLQSANTFYFTLCEALADQLDLDVLPSETWDENRGANANFERYIRRQVLKNIDGHFVWGLDEIDRLFGCEFGSEVFGLFRSWHNDRALDPSGPWSKLTLVIAYATEAHLFITDMNQSPFNVGTRLEVEDFSSMQVAEMNRRYRSPLKSTEEIGRLVKLVAGHPYLVRRALHELATNPTDKYDQFEELADQDEGIYGDHLRRILVLLAKDPELLAVMHGVLEGQPCPTPESFYRLRSAGLVRGSSQNEVLPRCKLYQQYLKRHMRQG
ncbi:MAG: AAA-like domain-containing protein [Verrucomicrobiia bacterium]|jgi:hypothetical protein